MGSFEQRIERLETFFIREEPRVWISCIMDKGEDEKGRMQEALSEYNRDHSTNVGKDEVNWIVFEVVNPKRKGLSSSE